MEQLRQLENKTKDLWRRASQEKDAFKKELLLKQHREFYEKYKKQRMWLNAIEEQ